MINAHPQTAGVSLMTNLARHAVNAPDLAAALVAEQQLEKLYIPIGLALDINRLMPDGVSYNRFTVKYSKFAGDNPTPDMMLNAETHAQAFKMFGAYEDEMAEGAVVWVISRIWATKQIKGSVFTPGLLDRLIEVKEMRDQKVALHTAVARLAKGKSEDTFEAGLKVNVTQVLSDAGALQLADLTKKVEVSHEAT